MFLNVATIWLAKATESTKLLCGIQTTQLQHFQSNPRKWSCKTWVAEIRSDTFFIPSWYLAYTFLAQMCTGLKQTCTGVQVAFWEVSWRRRGRHPKIKTKGTIAEKPAKDGKFFRELLCWLHRAGSFQIKTKQSSFHHKIRKSVHSNLGRIWPDSPKAIKKMITDRLQAHLGAGQWFAPLRQLGIENP